MQKCKGSASAKKKGGPVGPPFGSSELSLAIYQVPPD
jgi:hypothetical protein